MLNWDDEPNTQTRPGAQEGPAPVNVDDKRVINGETDINQLAPFKYHRAPGKRQASASRTAIVPEFFKGHITLVTHHCSPDSGCPCLNRMKGRPGLAPAR